MPRLRLPPPPISRLRPSPRLAPSPEDKKLGPTDGATAPRDAAPTEDELVLHYLRPQLRGFLPRAEGVVLDDNPYASPPWDLLARHGRSDEGFFFVARSRKRANVRRAVGGSGVWMRSSTKKGVSVTEMGTVVRWSRETRSFYVPAGEEGPARSVGWMMEEYEITDPRCYRRADDGEEDEYWVLCHVRRCKKTKRHVQHLPVKAST